MAAGFSFVSSLRVFTPEGFKKELEGGTGFLVGPERVPRSLCLASLPFLLLQVTMNM